MVISLISCREEHDRRGLEANIKELQMRLEEAESNALRGGKKLIEKLEHQVRNLNEELDTEQRFKADLTKNMRKSERRYREIEFQHEEEKKITERLQVNCIQFTLKYELEHQRKEIGFCCKVYASKIENVSMKVQDGIHLFLLRLCGCISCRFGCTNFSNTSAFDELNSLSSCGQNSQINSITM